MTISKHAAIAQARKLVQIDGRYTVIGPHRNADPQGPYTEVTRPTYVEARTLRAAWVARLALRLMGVVHEDAGYYTHDASGSVPQRVDYALRKIAAAA